MADDAAGSDGPEDSDPDGDERRRTSVSDPDAHRSTDETADPSDRRPGDDRLTADRDAADADDEPYRIPLDLSGDRDGDGTDDPAMDDAAADEDDRYGPEPSSTPVEPGDPDLEHVIFVFLGAIAMVLVLFRVATLPL